MKLSYLIENFENQVENITRVSEFQKTFLEIGLSYYKDEFANIHPDFILYDIEELNSTTHSYELSNVLKFLVHKINIAAGLKPSDKNFDNIICAWFRDTLQWGDFKKGKRTPSFPDKETIYKICILLKWTQNDCNKIFSSLGIPLSDYSSCLCNTVYHYALLKGKDLSFVENTLKSLSEKSYEDLPNHYSSYNDMTRRIQATFAAIFNNPLVDHSKDDHEFLKKMEQIVKDFTLSSGRSIKISNAIARGGDIKISFEDFYNFFSLDRKSKKTEEHPSVAGYSYIRKIFADFILMKKEKSVDKSQMVSTREFIILLSIQRWFTDEKIRENNDNLIDYVNNNLLGCDFPINCKTPLDLLVCELSKYTLILDENKKAKFYYENEEVDLYSDGYGVSFFSENYKATDSIKKANKIIKEYNNATGILNSIKLCDKSIRIKL